MNTKWLGYLILGVVSVSLRAEVFNVGSVPELNSVLKNIKGGDRIILNPGDYGHLELNGTKNGKLRASKAVTIVSANLNQRAVFTGLTATRISHFVLEGLKLDYAPEKSPNSQPFIFSNLDNLVLRNLIFEGHLAGGYGTGYGIKINKSSNITLENSKILSFNMGLHCYDVHNFVVRNNVMENIAQDGIQMSWVTDTLIEGNTIKMKANPVNTHHDGIQISNAPSSEFSRVQNLTLRKNTVEAGDAATHGIYLGGGSSGDRSRSTFYLNVLISGNTVRSGHSMGIAIAEVDGLKVTDNLINQHSAISSNKPGQTPALLVRRDSLGVTITENKLLRAPAAADSNYQPLSTANLGWIIKKNTITPLK